MYKINGHKLLQFPGELEELCTIFCDNDVTSYLEIGCKFGGSMWTIGMSLPKGSRIVAVDLMMYGDIAARLRAAAADLSKAGYKVHLISGDSRNPNVVRDVRKLGPFDACLIDGDHRLEAVRTDWENYGAMSRLVAFHDINYFRTPEELRQQRQLNPGVLAIDVPKFWNEIKKDYRHVEIKKDKQDNGIGVLWR